MAEYSSLNTLRTKSFNTFTALAQRDGIRFKISGTAAPAPLFVGTYCIHSFREEKDTLPLLLCAYVLLTLCLRKFFVCDLTKLDKHQEPHFHSAMRLDRAVSDDA